MGAASTPTRRRARHLRRLLTARAALPAAVVGGVAMAGLVAFGPAPASAVTGGVSTGAGSGAAAAPVRPPAGTGSGGSSRIVPSGSVSVPGSGLAYVALPATLVRPGQALFAANCSTCHGSSAEGTARAPNLQGLGAGTVDFWVSTGRMPLANSSVQAIRKPPRFNRMQTLELAAFVQSFTPGVGVGIPVVKEQGADLENGNAQYTLNCAACHTITGAGDALAEGAYAPTLHLATTTQIVEAIRSGPGNMPRFAPGNITDREARDVAAYVREVIQHPVNRGGVGLGGIGPVGEGFIGLLVGVGVLMLAAFWIGDRT